MISKLISISGSIVPHYHARMHVMNGCLFLRFTEMNLEPNAAGEWYKIPHILSKPTKVRASLSKTCKEWNSAPNSLKYMQNSVIKWIHELMYIVVKILSNAATARGVATCSTNIACGTTTCIEFDTTANRCKMNSCNYYYRCDNNDLPIQICTCSGIVSTLNWSRADAWGEIT